MFRLEKVFQQDDYFFISISIFLKSVIIFLSIYIFSILEFNSIFDLFNYNIYNKSKYFYLSLYFPSFYLLFSLILPLFVYLNLCKIYPNAKTNNLIISSSLLFLPFYKASAIWPNAHLTSLIFLAVANYCYVVNLQSEKFIYKFLNIFF